MDAVKSFAGPVATLIGGIAPVATSLIHPNKMPKVEQPKPVATPTMPTPDDASAKQASLMAVAKRASQHGRTSTNLYEKESLGA